MLDGVPLGIVLCSGDALVTYQNQASRTLLLANDGIALRNGRLSLWNADDREAVLNAIRIASLPGGVPPFARSIRRRSDRRPLQCVITRLWPDEEPSPFRLIEQPTVAVYLADPERPLETPQELLQRLFGLTRQEAAVAERLAAGGTLDAIATELEISLETVRSHLKAVFAKTNTNRQADLVRLITTSPLWLRFATSAPMLRAAD